MPSEPKVKDKLNTWEKIKFGFKNPLKALMYCIYIYVHWIEKKEILENFRTEVTRKRSNNKYYSEIGLLLKHSPNIGDEHVLDLGCGPGRYTSMLIALGYRVTAADIVEYKQWSFFKDHMDNCRFDPNTNAESLPYENGAFDHAVCIGTIFYLERPEKAISELTRVVKSSGKILISTINTESHHSNADKMSKTKTNANLLDSEIKKHNLAIKKKFFYGYEPSRFKKLFHLLYYSILPSSVYDWLSRHTAKEKRPVIVYHCIKKNPVK